MTPPLQRSPLAGLLLVDRPDAALESRLQLFGQFVGAWDLEVTDYPPGKEPIHARGEWHFGWVLEGRAIQDVWIVPPRRERSLGAPVIEYGTSLRFYDAGIDAWRSTWMGPVKRKALSFIARPVGAEIILARTDSDGTILNWIFSEITGKSFRWRAQISTDGGFTWQRQQEMAVTRMAGPCLQRP